MGIRYTLPDHAGINSRRIGASGSEVNKLVQVHLKTPTWKKTKERNKTVFFIFMDKQKIGRAATLAGIPLAVRKHFEKGASGNN